MSRVSYIQNLFQDIRYAFRIIVKNPNLTLVAIATLSLGIGANTAIFSLVNGILLRPLPYPEPDQLVRLTEYYPKGGIVLLQEQLKSMEVAAIWPGEEFNLTQSGQGPIRLKGTMVSANLFSVLGVNAELGRIFRAGEDTSGKDNVVILSHAVWQNQFGGDQGILGRWIVLEGESRQVVGVMPPDFTYPSSETQLWIPLKLYLQNVNDFWGPEMSVIGRLQPAFNHEQARQEVQTIIPTILASVPFPKPPNWNKNSIVIPLQQDMVRNVRTNLFILLAAVGLVLLMACANVANLLLARSSSRQKEVAIRSALGAGRWRIIRQLLTESVLLALCGGALGVLLATQGVSLLKSLLPADTPRLSSVTIDWQVLVFTALLAILTGLVFGIAPALNSSKIDFIQALKAGGRHSSRASSGRTYNALVVIEVGMAVVLVIGAGLLIKSLRLLAQTDPGFRSENIMAVQVTPDKNFCKERTPCVNFYDELLRRVKAVPGVESVAAVNSLPLSTDYPVLPLSVEGYQPDQGNAQAPLVRAGAITPEFNQIMEIPILAGRAFTESDQTDVAGAVLVSASTAQRFWPGQNPVGRQIKPVWEKEWRTVVGVIADVKLYGLDRNRPGYLSGEIYMPYPQAIVRRQAFPISMNLLLRTSGDQVPIGNQLRDVVASLNSDVAVGEVRTMKDVIAASISTPNSTTWLFSIFSALALSLGAVGIYSLISFSVVERTHEIGMRMALGATGTEVLKLILKRGMTLALIGIVLGTAAAFGLTRFLASLLHGVEPVDFMVFASAPLVLLGVALLASFIPARRATKVDPMEALRIE